MFYFTYTYPEGIEAIKGLTYLYNKKICKFQQPDIVKLRDLFERIYYFLYSDAFYDLIKRILVEWYAYLGPNETGAMDNIILVSISLAIMLKASLCQNIDSRFYKTIDFIFGIREDLGDKNVMTLLAFLKKKIHNEIFSSIVDHLMELSQFPENYFDDLSDNPSDMINKSKDCRDLAFENLESIYEEISINTECLENDITDKLTD
ncbi:hypothetical protein RF11_07443 [Thelohanellus kitauei]|uniref:Uncharacterized protein n=1 Tax=Thelohanellus kitauei TaxID=669202 RepID=A0A0C2JTZ2_THEKT|nr:hypothetical protein RF11_07443 [Thelohanellus kitauei]